MRLSLQQAEGVKGHTIMNVSSMNSERKLCVQSTIEKESAVVVLYLHSTSSHNARGKQTSQSLVVLYLHSTSNHNDISTL